MSEVKVNKISPRTNCGTVTLGDSGDSFVIPAGATITNNGTQTGFGRTGTVDWDTTAKTAGFTAVSGNGYFVNTTSGAITVTLPAGSAGDIVSLADYAATWQTNNVTVTPNGTDKIGGVDSSVTLNTEGQSVTFVYTDSTQGWLNTMDSTSNVRGNSFIVATGGTETTCGDYKIHTFTGPGTFCVSSAGIPANSNVDYLVVAGGGGGGSVTTAAYFGSGGGGAGGFRLSNSTCMPAPLTSPLATPTSLPVSVTGYPITVGGGGAGGAVSPTGADNAGNPGTSGNNSIFSTITSTGGGYGGGLVPCRSGASGGSGGGSRSGGGGSGGTGNTPPVSPPQGNNGGTPSPNGGADGGAGGGGACAGGTGGGPGSAGNGGAGSYVLGTGFAGSNGTPGPVCGAKYFAGGGGGGGYGPSYGGGNGGVGGGANSPPTSAPTCGQAGTTNTGGGGSGVLYSGSDSFGGSGGSGIVIIRYKYK